MAIADARAHDAFHNIIEYMLAQTSSFSASFVNVRSMPRERLSRSSRHLKDNDDVASSTQPISNETVTFIAHRTNCSAVANDAKRSIQVANDTSNMPLNEWGAPTISSSDSCPSHLRSVVLCCVASIAAASNCDRPLANRMFQLPETMFACL